MPKVFGPEVRSEFFGLVCGGASLQTAARVCGVSGTQARAWWRASGLVEPQIAMGPAGGLPGTAPADVPGDRDLEGRRRRPLTAVERGSIAAALRLGHGYAEIAATIGRDKSVVSREVARNRGPDGSYEGAVAHRDAHERRRRPKVRKLTRYPGLCRRIEAWMDQGWSPKLIAAVLRRDHPDSTPESMMERVSHETIYQALYVQTRGGLRKDLYRQLSLKRRARKPRSATTSRPGMRYAEAFTIADRPAEVADRAVPGNWEGDLIMGAGNRSAVGTLVERSTRFTILLHLPGPHDAHSVAEAMIREMSKLPEHLRASITWDRGSELADYKRIQLELGTTVYFCDPQSPWQRGSNENTNRLLRFWLEKGTDLSAHTQADLDKIAATLNARPRPTLDLDTPADRLAALLADPAAA